MLEFFKTSQSLPDDLLLILYIDLVFCLKECAVCIFKAKYELGGIVITVCISNYSHTLWHYNSFMIVQRFTTICVCKSLGCQELANNSANVILCTINTGNKQRTFWCVQWPSILICRALRTCEFTSDRYSWTCPKDHLRVKTTCL